ncbi:MAG: hypothetical protein HQL24_00070 [Candidatus Omnitrophica bacterium]|nr:hypothetical protein [Candidatus Omnitrophota bacterium]
MKKLNCWEYKKCGREPGGEKVKELGVCPVSTEKSVNGMNCGINGGRVCWAVTGTLCGGKVQGSFALKVDKCIECEFFALVMQEEGQNSVPIPEVLKVLKKQTGK